MAKEKSVIPIERIAALIYVIRGESVMLDAELAELYHVETGALVRAMKRNLDRFSKDFAFQLTKEEFDNLRSQTGISSWGGRRYAPYAFTEQGVAMLSGVLRSKIAVQVNVAIMRTFVRLRRGETARRAVSRSRLQREPFALGAGVSAAGRVRAKRARTGQSRGSRGMSFPRHEGIFRSDGRGSFRSGARSERLHAPTHRLDEFPTGYSSAGWSPPEPASSIFQSNNEPEMGRG